MDQFLEGRLYWTKVQYTALPVFARRDNRLGGFSDRNMETTRVFLVCIRLYGSSTEFYDQTWKPDDVVKVKLANL